MGKCRKRSTSVASGLSSHDFVGELKTCDRWTPMEQTLSVMIVNLKKGSLSTMGIQFKSSLNH